MAKSSLFPIRRAVQFLSQILLVLIIKTFLSPFVRIDSKAPEIKKQSHMLVANHKAALDPLAVLGGLPFKDAFKILPVAFMTANVFYDSIIRPILWLGASFPARNPKGKHKIYGVDGSVQLLQNNFSLFIFPEGRRVREAERGQAHSGVIRIHKAVPKAPFILCHITFNKGFKALFRGERYVVKYKLIQEPNYSDPELVMDDIFAL